MVELADHLMEALEAPAALMVGLGVQVEDLVATVDHVHGRSRNT